ncbi:MAG: hypothetical protein ABF461_08230 [Zymomonas mobilis subsp. pomaceae]|uniref:hypothetical protein n=1 Tax=Zymomonas mobilis TaxID=542 RepID=UPI0039ED780A
MTSRSATQRGLLIALSAHALLLLIFLIRFTFAEKREIQPIDTIEVTFANGVGMHSSSPEASPSPMRAQTAPHLGPEKEAAPVEKPAVVKEASPKATPKAVIKPEPTVQKTAPSKPAAEPTPTPKVAPPLPPKPEAIPQPKSVKLPTSKAEPSPKPAPKAESKNHTDVKNLMEAFSKSQVNVSDPKAVSNTDNNKGKEKNSAVDSQKGKVQNTRSSGAHLGPDFLKGITDGTGTSSKPQAAAISGLALNGLGASIKRQVQPCYDLGALGGTDAMHIVTVLRLRFNPDGSVNGVPEVIEQNGLNANNRSYARQMTEISRRAVLRCAPLHLPADLYKGGWDEIDIGFIPAQMH